MGIISIVKASHLLWLGRYAERTYTTMHLYEQYYDRMIDSDPVAYQKYCNRLEIPDVYGSKEVFNKAYIFNSDDPNSMVSNLTRAHDNAMVIRDAISSETLSYLELALNVLKCGPQKHTPLFEAQQVVDDLMAFWGCLDDLVDDEECRNVIKVGRYLERLDLYFRFGMPTEKKLKEYEKLVKRLPKSHLHYNEVSLTRILDIIQSDMDEESARYEALSCLGSVLCEAY